ncbi:hypothetical protein PSN45_005147 [Yamadazyma tenuis]|uniref:Major facilitator superfamily (MFS) profile domain-containing protein n=1 Tax=Candida tenuis (strain ATCC 10573 / BCRC 21748 / CBS 615 / JCM 9827 / NBRC 10315 / NRRL Y-1498 / VKM Y-70) TaxID=590646 RepID=G3B0T2_CANTC|nr:uncharacterized protein CANTEDRAFT_129990 [Yamadazyma tenuis ATCC 10573]EGV64795.1 hypothetical protein CANTEDRAFT_129990 [Yamadazyma tenuis ATCC 10573]WEJ97591.1 hypothetical protein PSN45_005147 [Yamadazyma tenuis]
MSSEKINHEVSVEEQGSTSIIEDHEALTSMKGLDKAFEFLDGKTISYTAEEEKAVLKRIDWHVMPLLFLLYLIQFADKTSLSYASLMGIRIDTHTDVGQRYSWVSSIFYAGYIFFEFPTTYFLTKLPIGKFLTFNILAWGIVITCSCAASNYASLLVLRFLLGMFECSITPGVVLIISIWYKRSEQGKRLGILLAANGCATILISPVAFGLSYITGAAIASWKILFLIFGSVTIVLGTFFFFYFPDNQLSAKFLSEEEKVIAIDRIRTNFQGVGSKSWKWYQFREAFQDPRTYLYMLYSLLMNIPNGGVTTFGSIIINSFGFDSQHSLLLSMPGGAVDIIFKLCIPALSDKLMDKSLPAAIAIAFPMIGGIMMSTLDVDRKGPLLVGYYFISAAGASWGLVMSMIGASSLGSTKKSVVNTCQIVCYAAGNWVGPQLWLTREAPVYPTGKKLVGIFYGCALGTLLVIRFVNIRENRRRDKLQAEGKIPPPPENAEFLDLTDFEQLNMRYII